MVPLKDGTPNRSRSNSLASVEGNDQTNGGDIDGPIGLGIVEDDDQGNDLDDDSILETIISPTNRVASASHLSPESVSSVPLPPTALRNGGRGRNKSQSRSPAINKSKNLRLPKAQPQILLDDDSEDNVSSDSILSYSDGDDELDAIQHGLRFVEDQFAPQNHLTRSDSSVFSAISDEGSVAVDEESGFNRLRRRKRANTFSDEEMKNIPRLVHRNLPFKQSRQEIAVTNKTIFRSLKMHRILSQDWYHVFLRQPTIQSITLLLVFWTLCIIIFAFIYMRVDRESPGLNCGLGNPGEPISFETAFAFSLETCTTVGYGLPNGTNGFFETPCKGLQASIYFQMIWSMLFNAFLFSFIFARLARCESRGAQVLFSDKAIIEKRDGKWMMHVRIYDLDSAQPVVEAHVRMYCVSWRDYERQTRDLVQPHLLHVMRILQPNDELGATMFTSIPANVTHRIDAFSPLAPIRKRRRTNMLGAGGSAGLALREVDQDTGSRGGVVCPACGETYGSMFHLRRHINYTKMVEDADENFPMVGSHRDKNLIKPDVFKPFVLLEEDIREQLRDKEIMCVVEGIEPMVSGTFQALHSYKLNDIVFGGRFEPCMTQTDGRIFVDIDKFHTILPPTDASIQRYSFFEKEGHNENMGSTFNFFKGENTSLRGRAAGAGGSGRPPLCIGKKLG